MLRSLWKLQWKQFAARMKKGNGKKTSGGWLAFLMLFFVVCMEILMFVGFAELVPLCEMGLTWLYFAMAGTVALALSMLLGLVVCYDFGTAWFLVVYTKNTGAIGLWTALGWCVFPYILPDCLKIALALAIRKRLAAAIRLR